MFEPVPNDSIDMSEYKQKIIEQPLVLDNDFVEIQNPLATIDIVPEDKDLHQTLSMPRSLKVIYEEFSLSKKRPTTRRMPTIDENFVPNVNNNPYGDHQRAIIVALAKQQFDVKNPNH